MMPIKDPAESVVIEFDFSAELASIGSASTSASVYGDGTDPDVATLLEGAPQISGTSVLQRVRKDSGIAGLDYKLRCVATTGADVIVRADVMPVRVA